MVECLDCDKSASFNYKGEKKPLYCNSCKLDGMISTDNRKCLICKNTRPLFNYKNEKKPTHCNGCKLDGMINIKDKRCLGCNDKQPSFNYKDNPKPLYCDGCKLDGMVDVKNRNKKCILCEDKRANFNYKGEKKPIHCNDCKLKDMINIVNAKCLICKKTQPHFNYRNEKIATHCGKCKLKDMINIITKKCVVCNDTQPNFNYKGEKKATHCSECKLKDMVNVKSKKCLSCNNKEPNFNYKCEKKAIYCFVCKLDDMVDVRHKKCVSCDFNRQDSRFKPLCFTCYRFDNPNADFTRNFKIKENTIMKFVKDNYSNCVIDSIISGGCSKRRPDGLIDYELFSVIIEIDEDSHKNYDDICENKRLMEIYRDLNFKPLRVIRFNPDAYKDINGKRIDSIFSLDSDNKLKVKTKKELNRRVNILLDTIEKVLEKINQDIIIDVNNIKGIDVEYLFFDENE